MNTQYASKSSLINWDIVKGYIHFQQLMQSLVAGHEQGSKRTFSNNFCFYKITSILNISNWENVHFRDRVCIISNRVLTVMIKLSQELIRMCLDWNKNSKHLELRSATCKQQQNGV